MTTGKKSPIEKLAKVNQFLLEAYDQKCLDYSYEKMIQEMSETSWDSAAGVGGRQWIYQTCTEFGWYQSSNQVNIIITTFFLFTIIPRYLFTFSSAWSSLHGLFQCNFFRKSM